MRCRAGRRTALTQDSKDQCGLELVISLRGSGTLPAEQRDGLSEPQASLIPQPEAPEVLVAPPSEGAGREALPGEHQAQLTGVG